VPANQSPRRLHPRRAFELVTLLPAALKEIGLPLRRAACSSHRAVLMETPAQLLLLQNTS